MGDLNGEAQQREQAFRVGIHRHVLDVRAGLGDGGGHLGQNAAGVFYLHLDADIEEFAFFRLPFDIYPLLRLGRARLADCLAVVRVDDEAAALLDRADDRIAGDRLTAARQLDRHAFGAVNGQRDIFWRVLGDVLACQQTPRHYRGEAFAEADVGIQIFERFLSVGLD